MSDDDKALRLALAERLAAGGHLLTAPWRSAVETVARHEFLGGGFFERADGPGPTAWRPVMPDDPQWLQRCYDDESLVTQIAGTIVPRDIRGEIMRSPTSSRTLPSLVVRMLEDLQVADGHKVQEIGTGYSTGLLCARLGDDLVTSKEVDPDVAAAAAVALGACGYFPDLVVGDGLVGHPAGAPYDRTIATCAVRELPYAWVEQTKPGGLILATLCGWMYASELAQLTVGDDGIARGRFLGGHVAFMLARPHLPPDLGTLPDLDDADEQPTEIGADALDDWTTRFVAQLAAPRAQRISLERGGRTEHVLLDVDAGDWAALTQDDRGTWAVRQGGPARLWDDVAEHIARWRGAGAPGLDRFEVTVSPEGQSVSWSKV
ncbi:ATP-grasp peptide maturase system methyltransferase [Streptomyces sp. NPDC048629]|uniref:ATP-grasp peptide maturase system methyltransferase n=1 Tax=Streptomyces sp. NPDC048629 TaxID=3154824 RepID=UPI003412BC32